MSTVSTAREQNIDCLNPSRAGVPPKQTFLGPRHASLRDNKSKRRLRETLLPPGPVRLYNSFRTVSSRMMPLD